MWYWYLLALMVWVGTVFGFLIAVVILPGAAVFPLLYWFIEGVLPMHYLLAWVVGVAALAIAGGMFQRRIGYGSAGRGAIADNAAPRRATSGRRTKAS